MSETNHIDHLLHDYLDGDLAPEARHAVQQHLESCTACRESYAALQALHFRLDALPTSIAPSRDLWAGIEAQIKLQADPPNTVIASDRRERGNLVELARLSRWLPRLRGNRFASRNDKASDKGKRHTKDAPSRRLPEQAERAPARAPRRAAKRTRWQQLGVAASLVLLVGLVAFWAVDYFMEPSWEVAFHDDATPVRQGQVRVGEWIETGAASRAVIEVGRIGEVEVSPESRVQLRETKMTDNRLLLAEGRIDARIWAPPRLFFVETPAALAVDLGCAYTLTVDSLGTSLLHVTSGYVELVREGRETLVPAGAMCRARPGYGPGTAFDQKASAALQEALVRYDFEQGGAEALSDILAEARATDGITLWQLFFLADAANRARIHDRLAALVPPPEGVTRDGVFRNDPDMLDRWQRHLGLAVMSWKGYLKKKNKIVE